MFDETAETGPQRDPDEIEIARLAILDGIDYARQRKEAALRLGIPLKLLDRLVESARRAAGTGGDSAPGADPDAAILEDEIARGFAETYAGRMVFDHTSQRWSTWTGKRWLLDETDSAFFAVRNFCRQRMHEAAGQQRTLPIAMGKVAFAANVEKAARSDPKLAVTASVWDRDPWLLGVPGAVVDLRTGKTRAPDPALYISRETGVAPAPHGTDAPIWRGFLRDATGGDAEFEAFLQRLCGYLLTGCVNEEIVAFFYGDGGNGKGTFLRPVVTIAADYAAAIPIEVFTVNGRINLEYYRAKMFGRRVITTVEPENGAEWSESTIKEISGNETPLSARHPYGRPFECSPVCKIVAVGNHAPKLKGRTPAMERRLRIAPFDHKPERADPSLKERLIPEYPAILRWMVDGCLLWQREGLGTCDAVRRASEAFFERQDAFRQWLDECCVLDPTLSEKPGALLAAFNAWAKAGGREPLDANAFAETVDRTPSLQRGKWNGVRLVRGVGLKPPGDDRGDP